MYGFVAGDSYEKCVDVIIGNAAYEIIQAGLVDHITSKMLIQHLTRKYVYIYDTSASVEESLLYEAAIKLLISPALVENHLNK